MVSFKNIVEQYKSRIDEVELHLQREKRTLFSISLLRLFLFFALIAFLILAFSSYRLFYLIILILLLISFGIVLRIFFKKDQIIKSLICKKNILQNEVSVLNGKRNDNYNGEAFIDKKHDYSEDLDVFGADSIYSIVNRCRTNEGLKILSNYMGLIPEFHQLELRQTAIQELENMHSWSLDFQSILYNIDKKADENIIEKLNGALTVDTSFGSSKLLIWYQWLLPLFWLSFILFYWTGVLSNFAIAVVILLINFSVSIYLSKKMALIQNALSFINQNIGFYIKGVEAINQNNWKSNLLGDLKQRLFTDNGMSFVVSLRGLKRLSIIIIISFTVEN